jgi:hypothetical protein
MPPSWRLAGHVRSVALGRVCGKSPYSRSTGDNRRCASRARASAVEAA